MTNEEKKAAELAEFYRGMGTPPAPSEPVTEHEIRGGLYTAEEQAASAAAMAKPIVPGSWEDLEMRGINFNAWPDDVREQFIRDQSDPNYVPPTPITPTPTETIHVTSADIPTIVGEPDYRAVINALAQDIHNGNIKAGWWTDIATGQTLLGKDEHGRDRRNVGELLCLVHSEISEAMEGYRKNLMDDKLPHRPMLEVELADAIIRICDIAGAHNLDLGGAVAEKRSFNATREDHSLAHRLTKGGKKF